MLLMLLMILGDGLMLGCCAVLMILLVRTLKRGQQIESLLEAHIKWTREEVEERSDHLDALVDEVLERIAEVRAVQERMEQANRKGLGIFRFTDPECDTDG